MLTHLAAWTIDQCRQRLDATSASELDATLAQVSGDPSDAHVMHVLALHCLQCGYVDLWRHYVIAALALPHVSPRELYLRGQAKIRLGDWTGWVDREARICSPNEFDFQSPFAHHIRWANAAWDGVEDLSDGTLFVFADGGMGDCIQMLRYVPVLAGKGGEIVLAVHPRCVPFVRHNVGHLATVVIRNLPYPHSFQRYAWLMSLAGLVGHIPSFTPLSAPSPCDCPSVLDGKLHLALCWAGNSNYPRNRTDRFRSLSLCDLAPALSCEGVTWHSVQVGTWAAEAAAYPSIVPPIAPLYNLAQTANVLAGMDGVVTVDTSVAHLAGSLGIPTFLILSTAADFRWETADTTPWYPSVRLIRQRTPGDWSAVVAALLEKLHGWMRSRALERSSLRA
jgi:hypothetical protein